MTVNGPFDWYQTAENGVSPRPEPYSGQSATSASVSGKYEKLSCFVHASIPRREIRKKICKAGRRPAILTHELLVMPYTSLDKSGLETAESLLEVPGPTFHPVLIARYMLRLAIFLQHVHPDLHEEIEGLSESPRVIMDRLAELAIRSVTTDDDLLGSIEGLECVMIECMYQANVGNLRRSWVAGRRAMGIAQLMGLDRSDHRTQIQVLDPKTKCHPQWMWFRIVFLDRQLCLLLGLPEGCLDRNMASGPVFLNDTPMGRLERVHCVLSSRILERDASNPSSLDYAVTRSLDVEMQKAARGLPSKWWLAPNLDNGSTDSQSLFWDTRRLFAQVLHYNLLNQLHLPYMLRSSSADRKYEYSRITCVNASREVLSRFITLRSVNRIAYSCRTADFLALMAAMTLLLAHLDSHHHPDAENLLAHQYLSDRAMIEQAQENMKEMNRLNSDALSAKSADLLRRLLAIDVETADDYSPGASRVIVQEAGPGTAVPDQHDDAVVTVNIPYFGILKIATDRISKESPRPQAPPTTAADRASTDIQTTRRAEQPRPGPSAMPGIEVSNPADAFIADSSTNDIPSHATPQSQDGFFDSLLQQDESPALTARAEDWAFQGVDMAFFESLMRTAADEGNGDAEWGM